MADLLDLGQLTEKPSVEAAQSEEAYVRAERKALEEERKFEEEQNFLEEPEKEVAPTTKVTIGASSTVQAPPPSTKDDALIEVEKVLEDGLADVYMNLPDSAKPIFKKKGEEVASALAQMVRSFHVELKKALKLIRDWLLTIPKVSKFFLEQEAKVKVDMLKELVEERKQDENKLP